jgi:hypothetical protein
MKRCHFCGEGFRHYEMIEVHRGRQLWECHCPYCGKVCETKEFEKVGDIFTGQGFSDDIGSRAMLIKHIKRLCKEQGKNYKGFAKLKKAQLKAIYYKLKKLSTF